MNDEAAQSAEKVQYEGRAQGGLKSAEGRAAYWRMNHEYASHALSDLLTEHRELREAIDALADDWEREHDFTRECMDDDGSRCTRCTDIRALRSIATPPGQESS